MAQAAELYVTDRANLPPREQLGGLDPDILFSPQYFPLAESGGLLVVDTMAARPNPHRSIWWTPTTSIPNGHWTPVFPSVTACVELIVRCFREGWIHFNEEHGVLTTKFKQMPRELRSPIW